MKCKYETTGWHDEMKRCLGTKEVDPCPGYEKCQHYVGEDKWCDKDADCKGCWLDWLKLPYGGADHE